MQNGISFDLTFRIIIPYNSGMENINYRIKTLRNTLGMSQLDFGARLGMTTAGAIHNIEKGLNRADKIVLVLAICHAFGVSRDWLLDGKGEMFVTDEPTIIRLFSMLDSSDKDLVKKLMISLAAKNNNIN